MTDRKIREIPFNYTSADDGQIVSCLLGKETWSTLQRCRFKRTSGRAARLLMRFFGDMFILRRNAYIRHELITSPERRQAFFNSSSDDLATVARLADQGPEISLVIEKCKAYLDEVKTRIHSIKALNNRIMKKLGPIVGDDNVLFDPFTLTSHITDATNWRLYPPMAVVRPTRESQVPKLLKAAGQAGFSIIPRGGGTGLTGGSVPVKPGCLIINTEKLNHIRNIETASFKGEDGPDKKASVMDLEAGVITDNAIAAAKMRGLVFATDPTSSWACTIGGNIAENAGGKKAVLWGTAIDNLLSFKIAVPDGQLLEVVRANHPLRKIGPNDRVLFDILDKDRNPIRSIALTGTRIRKKGLGKDITNKALSGVPGIQKEGTDGIITSARFILHPAYPEKTTCCLEFFGDDMDEAGRVILSISRAFENKGKEALMALEHFDEEYVRAISYKVKAPVQELPKAVLLIDMVGQKTAHIKAGLDRLKALLKPYPNSHLFVAANEKEAARFWQDRKRLGAIAARTNSFKLNEDIVLPLAALADFAQFADQYNVEEQRDNQRSLVWSIGSFLENTRSLEDPEWLAAKTPTSKKMLMDTLAHLSLAGKVKLREETHIKRLMTDLVELFTGYDKVAKEIQSIYHDTRMRLIVIATHMHAGDGNIHVNIPVFPNDREMMTRAAETADAVMAKTLELGGVVSGEHGIGFTKLKYLAKDNIKALNLHRKKIDPNGVMNPGKLSDPLVPDLVYAPSFNLLGLEARILKHGALEALAGKISKCVRCGKCKSDCCVYYPAGNMFYHPRNKNLAIVSIIEAILYDSQRLRSARFGFLKHLEQVADQCTICHKCLPPCPVDIDTGHVSILERELLAGKNFKHTAPATAMALSYLDSRHKLYNALFRNVVLKWGGRLQRTGAGIVRRLPGLNKKPQSAILGMLTAPMPKVSGKTLYDIPAACNPNQTLVINPETKAEQTVFYFPGCGSERLFSAVSMAAVYILLKTKTRVLLPPPCLCCGYPAKVNAKIENHKKQTLQASIVLTQIREMFGHVTFDGVATSCGTCMEALKEMDLNPLFGCDIVDVSAWAMERWQGNGRDLGRFYHMPCHDSLKGKGPGLIKAFGSLLVKTVPHCCSEAGTLALSRPDISAAMGLRKRDALKKAAKAPSSPSVLLTNCPSCLSGLGKNADLGFVPMHLAQALALKAGGKNWMDEFKSLVSTAEAVSF